MSFSQLFTSFAYVSFYFQYYLVLPSTRDIVPASFSPFVTFISQTKVALYKSSQGQHADAKRRGSRASVTSKQLAGAGSIFAKRDRRSGTGMNPRSILTGFYDEETGARIRRVVHDGALRVPVQASIFQQSSIEAIVSDWPQKEKSGVLKALSHARNHDLPGVNDLIRPSLDTARSSTLVVTELSASSSGSTISRNVTVALKSPKTERIRGGGDEDDESNNDASMDIDMPDAAAPPSTEAATSTAPPANGNINGSADIAMQDATAPQPAATDPQPAATAPQPAATDPQPAATVASQPTIGGQEPPSSAPKPEQSNGPLPPASSAPSVDATSVSAAALAPSTSSPAPVAAPTPPSAPAPAPAPVPSNGSANIPTSSSTDQAPKEEVKAESTESSAQKDSNVNSTTKEESTTPIPSAQSAEGNATPKEEEKKDEQPLSVSSHDDDDDGETEEPGDLAPADTPPTVSSLSDAAKKKASLTEATASKNTVPPVDLPSWYDPEKVSDMEKRLLPEWFNDSASHRTEASYILTREKVIGVARADPDKFLTATSIRRCVVGDAGSLLRLHELLTHWRLINAFAAGESVPVAPDNRYQHDEMESRKRPVEETFWTEGRKEMLAKLVVENSNKKRKTDAMEEDTPKNGGKVDIDWKAIAADVGGGVSSTECQRTFLSLPLTAPSSDTKASHGSVMGIGVRAAREEILKDLIKDVRPEVIEAATKAALQTTGDLQEAQKGALLGSIAAKAEERAATEEESVNELLMELLDQRMKKLENRVSLLDEVEGMLEAERVSLELERRDLYTARCRHWFGGGN